ncbi:MAG TPA: hypothetical protein VMZ71_01180, partial [Gemmataceae bacterium]|nr:hypothetical protein [Gemmataceae bacterium]
MQFFQRFRVEERDEPFRVGGRSPHGIFVGLALPLLVVPNLGHAEPQQAVRGLERDGVFLRPHVPAQGEDALGVGVVQHLALGAAECSAESAVLRFDEGAQDVGGVVPEFAGGEVPGFALGAQQRGVFEHVRRHGDGDHGVTGDGEGVAGPRRGDVAVCTLPSGLVVSSEKWENSIRGADFQSTGRRVCQAKRRRTTPNRMCDAARSACRAPWDI